jgi:hypothetical protein
MAEKYAGKLHLLKEDIKERWGEVKENGITSTVSNNVKVSIKERSRKAVSPLPYQTMSRLVSRRGEGEPYKTMSRLVSRRGEGEPYKTMSRLVSRRCQGKRYHL